MAPSLPRRSFIIGSAAGVLATACGTDSKRTSTPTRPTGRYELIANFPRSDPYAAAGSPQRLPLLVAGPDGGPLDRIRDVTFTVTLDGRTVGTPTTVAARSDGLERAYLPLEVTFPEPGTYDIGGDYLGSRLTTALQVLDPSDVTLPQVGSKLPPHATPTTDDHRGVEPLCTREPVCPFHSVNLADSLADARPTLVLVSTPRYCQVAICGPVLDFLIEEASSRADLAVIHQEVYANPDAVESIAQATMAPLLTAYGMTFEPSLFVVDRTGTLVRRLDTIYDRTELADAIKAAVG